MSATPQARAERCASKASSFLFFPFPFWSPRSMMSEVSPTRQRASDRPWLSGGGNGPGWQERVCVRKRERLREIVSAGSQFASSRTTKDRKGRGKTKKSRWIVFHSKLDPLASHIWTTYCTSSPPFPPRYLPASHARLWKTCTYLVLGTLTRRLHVGFCTLFTREIASCIYLSHCVAHCTRWCEHVCVLLMGEIMQGS